MYLREAQMALHPNSAIKPQVEEKPKVSDLEFLEREIPQDEQQQQARRPPPVTTPTTTKSGEDELINKAKIQVERLKSSFDLLIQNQRAKQADLSYAQIEFERNHVNFNKSIRAYVDVCCNSPGLVSRKQVNKKFRIKSESNRHFY